MPELSLQMSYGLLFLVGLLTGLHCIGMCGGFVISYTAKAAKDKIPPHKMHMQYAAGKTISYTIIGAIFGLIGSVVAFTPKLRAIAGILAGIFLIIFGIKMLDIFKPLRKFRIKLPKSISRLTIKKTKESKSSPFKVGLLNGLMIACGPLQAMYIMAAGTASFIAGAKMLFVFGLGTLPAMIGFGYTASAIGRKATNKILKISGLVIIILGIIMLNRGLALSGSNYTLDLIKSNILQSKSLSQSSEFPPIKDGYQIIEMTVDASGYTPNKFVLKKSVPVKWIINGEQVTGCNNAIQVPALNMKFGIRKGIQTIEFTPEKEGVIRWSCWMGMIPGAFIVKDSSTSNLNKEDIMLPKARSCGCGG